MDYVLAVLGIVMVNILLSGDNALVIALASRNLAQKQQKQAMIWGSTGAIALRVILTFGAVLLLTIPYLQIIGGLMLLVIAVKLIKGNQNIHGSVAAQESLAKAIKKILTADVVMSLDNVLAIAGVAKGDILLLALGLGISIPLIVWGSKAIGALIEKWPVIITLGAAFLGWTGGEMVVSDKILLPLAARFSWLSWIIPGAFAILVVAAGKLLNHAKSKV